MLRFFDIEKCLCIHIVIHIVLVHRVIFVPVSIYSYRVHTVNEQILGNNKMQSKQWLKSPPTQTPTLTLMSDEGQGWANTHGDDNTGLAQFLIEIDARYYIIYVTNVAWQEGFIGISINKVCLPGDVRSTCPRTANNVVLGFICLCATLV